MNILEFSNEFDILYNSVMSNAAPGLNLYEKSVLLTLAQELIIKNRYSPKGNKYLEGIDDSPKRQIDLSSLIVEATSNNEGGITNISEENSNSTSYKYLLPSNIFIILNELATIQDGSQERTTLVVPIDYEDYTRLLQKPYKSPLKNQTWRLLQLGTLPSILSSILIPKKGASIIDYTIRYIRKPRPIILVNLNSEYLNVTIDGYSGPISTTGEACELNPEIHREILDRAVEIAKSSYMGDLNSMVQLNNRNE